MTAGMAGNGHQQAARPRSRTRPVVLAIALCAVIGGSGHVPAATDLVAGGFLILLALTNHAQSTRGSRFRVWAAGAAWITVTIVYWVSISPSGSGFSSPASFSEVLFYPAFIALLGLGGSALLSRGREWHWLIPVCGGVWAALTGVFWLGIATSRSSSLSDFSGGLFSLDVLAFLALAAFWGASLPVRRQSDGWRVRKPGR